MVVSTTALLLALCAIVYVRSQTCHFCTDGGIGDKLPDNFASEFSYKMFLWDTKYKIYGSKAVVSPVQAVHLKHDNLGDANLKLTPFHGSLYELENCKNVYIREYQDSAESDALNSVAPFTKQGNTLSYKIKAGTKEVVVIAADPFCRLEVEVEGIDPEKNFIPHSSLSFKKLAKTSFAIRVPAFDFPEKESHVAGRDYEYYKTKKTVNKATEAQCYSDCQYGRLISYEIGGTGTEFAIDFTLNSGCQWMKVYLNDKHTYKDHYIDYDTFTSAVISLESGFVVMPKRVRAEPMDFTIDSTTKGVTVLFGQDPDNTEQASLYILDPTTQTYVQSPIVDHTFWIGFEFSDPKCLKAPAQKSKMFAGLPKNGFFGRSMRYLADGDAPDPKTYAAPAAKITTLQPIAVTTQKAVISETTTVASTTFEPIATTNAVVPEFLDGKILEQMLNSDTKGWRTWGAIGGFIAGTCVSYVVGMIVIYIFRRSVHNEWYSEMYKRYGSEDSIMADTTMGKTVDASTIGSTMTQTQTQMTTVGSTMTNASEVQSAATSVQML